MGGHALRTTLSQYARRVCEASLEGLPVLLESIALGCKVIAEATKTAGLSDSRGGAGTQNIQGEEQKKLDVISNDVLLDTLSKSGNVAVIVSEENELPIFTDNKTTGKYGVVLDPMDGSSNIDCAIPVGTIFGVYELLPGSLGTQEDVLQAGEKMICAGYCLYGSSTVLVVSLGVGVVGFTLDTVLGEFVLSHPSISTPDKGCVYSINEGNSSTWDAGLPDQPTLKYVNLCKVPKDGGPPKSLRYIGSMVGDVHRTLLYGGVFIYPADKKSPKGKLRMLYECFPMAFLVTQAGGAATDGTMPILQKIPNGIHERSPICLGSKIDVQEYVELFSSAQSSAKM
ncbi:hypothetical protein CYMTET_41818 [Cymbomonas tetramitiformis]|uniref:Fructose-1,6-bisphosphatase, cytosolic n=1 Tax=Cymbomonas tetramitiformis TaxID=36881 RepID=A0AAE0C7F6_9CHLO|nr:hypothetical protein CYMTET_41818 [Cymbomonas tetramitiformis]